MWGAGLMRLSASAVVVIVIMLLFVLGATAAILDFNKRRGDRAKVADFFTKHINVPSRCVEF